MRCGVKKGVRRVERNAGHNGVGKFFTEISRVVGGMAKTVFRYPDPQNVNDFDIPGLFTHAFIVADYTKGLISRTIQPAYAATSEMLKRCMRARV